MRGYQINPQLTPQRARLRYAGLGDGLADFAALMQSAGPKFTGAWGSIQAQLSAEGADQASVAAAQIALASSFEQQIASSFGGGVDADTAIANARSYVLAGQTVLGAVQNVSGLISAGGVGAAPQILQSFTGTLVGAAAAAGAFSAGVGAAIVGGIGLVLGVLQQAGVLGTPSGTQVCPGVTCNPAPDWTIPIGGDRSCTCVWGKPALPGTALWRSFPSKLNADDSKWWSLGVGAWKGITVNGNVYSAFPIYWNLECEQAAPIAGWAGDFQRAFFQAWCANAAYNLNGIKPPADWQVLAHVARMWNRAHAPGQGYDFQPADASALAYTTGGSVSCPATPTPYINVLVGNGVDSSGGLAGNLATSDPLWNGSALHINTGPLLSVADLSSSSAPAASKAAPALAGAVAAGAAGVVVYHYLTGVAVGEVGKRAWGALTGLFK